MKRSLKILIASGPTREPLDPVRYLSNYSTGTMGKRLVEAAKKNGHRITWVDCPKEAETARDLDKKLKRELPKNDALIMAAAVCDVRPERVSSSKIKKGHLSSIRLVKNPDILALLSKLKKKRQVFVGFGLESEDLLKNGVKKLKKKKLDAILLQKVTEKNAPFGDKKIDAILLKKDGTQIRFRRQSKGRIAERILEEVERFFNMTHRGSLARLAGSF